MIAALTAQDVPAADQTPVNVLDKTAPQPAGREQDEDPEEKEKATAGAPHVLIVRTPDGRLTFLQAISSRRKDAIAAAIPALFTRALITDGYTARQHLPGRLLLDPAAADGITALDAIRGALSGKPWPPPLPDANSRQPVNVHSGFLVSNRW